MSTAIRRVRIMAGAPVLLSGEHARPRLVQRLVRLHVPRLVQLAAVVGAAAEAVADAGEV